MWQWLAVSETELPAGSRWLSPAEERRAVAMRFPKRRSEYLLRRLAGKRAVATSLGWPWSAARLSRIEVLNHPGGAPYAVVDGSPLLRELSLTDRAGWAVALITASPDVAGVGADLELVQPRSGRFVADYLSAAEQAAVARCRSEAERHLLANLVWSAKESAVKALHVGLRIDTRLIEVSVREGRRRPGSPAAAVTGAGWLPLRIVYAGVTPLPGWFRRDGDFLLTVAAPQRYPPPTLHPASSALPSIR